ncbi:hypothetical protein KZZ52_53815 [Dactylosporangium sp. AC04546]|uniref:hypothetical protein n=1 Tax=Dactylosporangium sp. AC04546 TaxID=2862460 RepID=UPI001EDD4BDC|nr:hypothetical protein [Dactylosporangium sp. AC04546]WVK82733.1 hypothetical protein KZZ52_53815 [Dactylosporangium sp. AC04546]
MLVILDDLLNQMLASLLSFTLVGGQHVPRALMDRDPEDHHRADAGDHRAQAQQAAEPQGRQTRGDSGPTEAGDAAGKTDRGDRGAERGRLGSEVLGGGLQLAGRDLAGSELLFGRHKPLGRLHELVSRLGEHESCDQHDPLTLGVRSMPVSTRNAHQIAHQHREHRLALTLLEEVVQLPGQLHRGVGDRCFARYLALRPGDFTAQLRSRFAVETNRRCEQVQIRDLARIEKGVDQRQAHQDPAIEQLRVGAEPGQVSGISAGSGRPCRQAALDFCDLRLHLPGGLLHPLLGIASGISDALPRGARAVGNLASSGAGNVLQPSKPNFTRVHRHPFSRPLTEGYR